MYHTDLPIFRIHLQYPKLNHCFEFCVNVAFQWRREPRAPGASPPTGSFKATTANRIAKGIYSSNGLHHHHQAPGSPGTPFHGGLLTASKRCKASRRAGSERWDSSVSSGRRNRDLAVHDLSHSTRSHSFLFKQKKRSTQRIL